MFDNTARHESWGKRSASATTAGGARETLVSHGPFLKRAGIQTAALEQLRIMKIATFNVNGITSRLSSLLEWLGKESPDIVCLQELKAINSDFPEQALQQAGYSAIWQGQRSWNGVAILAKGVVPMEIRRGLPGDDADEQSRYLEAAVDGLVVACLYLPNGNPQPGPKFDYKLAWFQRLIKHARTLWKTGHPAVLAGDFNVVPTDFDIYNTRSWKKDALLQPESRAAYQQLLAQGWTDALRLKHPGEAIYTFWDYFRNHWQTNSGLRIDHLLLSASLKPALIDAGVDKWVRGRPHASDHAPAWITLRESRRTAMSSAKQKTAARKNIKKAAKAASPKRRSPI